MADLGLSMAAPGYELGAWFWFSDVPKSLSYFSRDLKREEKELLILYVSLYTILDYIYVYRSMYRYDAYIRTVPFFFCVSLEASASSGSFCVRAAS